MKSAYLDDVAVMFGAGGIPGKEFEKKFEHCMKNMDISSIELGGRIYKKFLPEEWRGLWERSLAVENESWKLSYMVYWEMYVLFKDNGEDGKRIQDTTERILKEVRKCGQEEKEEILKRWILAAYSMKWNDILNPMAVFYDMTGRYSEYSGYDRKLIVDTFLEQVISARGAGIQGRSMTQQERLSILNDWVSEYIRFTDVDMPYKKRALAAVVECIGDTYIKEQDRQIKKNRSAVRFGFVALVLSLGFLGISAGLYMGRAGERRKQYLEDPAAAVASGIAGGEEQTGLEEETGAEKEIGMAGETSAVPAGRLQTQSGMGKILGGTANEDKTADRTVDSNGATSSNAMMQEADSEEEVNFSQTKSIVITKDMNIRNQPSIEAEKIGRVPSGDRVEAMGKKGDWLKIRYTESGSEETIEGYIFYSLPK